MKLNFFLLAVFILISLFSQNINAEKVRLVILADMGNEPDEEQQMIHMLLYSNEFDLEGLIAVTGRFLRPSHWDPYRRVVHPELFHQLIDGYSKDYDNLQKHAEGYPEPEYLRSIVAGGQPGYGIEGTGEGMSSEGSSLLLEIFKKDDDRPIYIVVNAGSNTLLQAIQDFERVHTKQELDILISKLRVYENGAQDNAGAWICANYPDIHWMRSNYQTYAFAGRGGPHTWKPYDYSPLGQHQWALEHIIAGHGYLGALYPIRLLFFGPYIKNGIIEVLEGGGTIPWIGLVNKGLWDMEHPHWGGWGGRFTREKVKNYWSRHNDINSDEKLYDNFFMYIEDSDYWIDPENGTLYNDIDAPVLRFRQAMFNDLQCRMDWCVKTFNNANHNPVAAVNENNTDQIIYLSTKAGEEIVLDASASYDPDGDELEFLWWNYFESGTHPERIEFNINNASNSKMNFKIPDNAAGKDIHIILEVKDNSPIAALYDYRRIVIKVTE